MVRKIPIQDLKPGMYVVDLHKSWFHHSLWRQCFFVRDEALIRRLVEDGVTEVSIDPNRGLDLPVPTEYGKRLPGSLERKRRTLCMAEKTHRLPPAVAADEERWRANHVRQEAHGTVRRLIHAAKAGRVVDAGRLEPAITRMMESVLRNPDALVSLARLKTLDSYATEHAVASTALIIALAHQRRLGQADIEKLALGNLVKDVGEAALDAKLIGKRGELSKDEFSRVQSHVQEGMTVLMGSTRLPERALAVVQEHHERFDGSGYPHAMAGEDISDAGRMAAIVDTYDAMTSDRPYRSALSPAAALRLVYQEGGTLFDPEMVASFVRTIGVYPVGTLVRLESGHLGVVDEVHHDDLLRPIVRIIFHAEHRRYVTPVQVDLSRRHGNQFGQIVRAEEFRRWGINPRRWQPA